jgi:hypothetical protein
MKASPPPQSDAQLKKLVVLIAGFVVLVLAVGGVAFSMLKTESLKEYWMVVTPLILAVLSLMRFGGPRD